MPRGSNDQGNNRLTVGGSPVLQVYIAPLMPKGSNDQDNNNWHRLWESNRKFRLQATRAWLQQLSTSPSSIGTLSVPPFTSDPFEAITMLINPMIQSPEDQFLH